MTQNEIASKMGMSPSWIRLKFKKLGIMARHSHRIFHLDEHFFDKIDTHEKAYWLGFLLADGNIDKSNYSIRIGLQWRDAEHLKKLRRTIKYGGSVKHYKFIQNNKIREKAHLGLASKYLCNSLAKIGWHEFKKYGKTSILEKVEHKVSISLIRGLIDGDGSIGNGVDTRRNNYAFLHFTDLHKNVVEWFVQWMSKHFQIPKMKVRANNSAWAVRYGSIKQLQIILPEIYAVEPWLRRKKEKVRNITSIQISDKYEVGKNLPTAKLVKINNITDTYAGWCRRTGIHKNLLRSRLKHKWELHKALTTPANPKFNRYRYSSDSSSSNAS